MLKRIKVRSKLLVLVVTPLIALAAFATTGVQERLERSEFFTREERIAELADAGADLSLAVHVERNRTLRIHAGGSVDIEGAVTATDAWDRIFRYRVNQEFAWPALTGQPAAPQPPPNNQLDMTDIGDIVVVTRGAAKSLLIETQAAAAVVYSVGIGGHGGTNLNGDTQPLPGALDQRSNVDGVYVAGTATGADDSANLTDDDADFVAAGVQVEHIVFNVSDRSHARVTNVATTTLTLDGPFSGTDNDFDQGDRYAVSPFVTRSYTPPTPDCQDRFGNASFPCGFDDLIVTVPAGVLKSRLIEANLLP